MLKEIAQGMLIAIGIIGAVFITALMAFIIWAFIADGGVETYSRAQLQPERKMQLYDGGRGTVEKSQSIF